MDTDETSAGSVADSTDHFSQAVSDDPMKIQLNAGQLALDIEPVATPQNLLPLATGESLDFPMDMEPRKNFLFCPDEPLNIEDDTFLDHIPGHHDFPLTSTFSSPHISSTGIGKDACVGSIPLSKVHNTFIHSPVSLPTPLRARAAKRSRSLTKDFGSDKNAWEATCQALGCSSGHDNVPEQDHPDVTDRDQRFEVPDTPFTWAPPVYVPGAPAVVPPSPTLTASPGSRRWKPVRYSFHLEDHLEESLTMDRQIINLADYLR
jgi:hypothetical protein